MKNLSSILLALAFVCFSLISLLSVNPDWDHHFSPVKIDDARLSELGLRFKMQP